MAITRVEPLTLPRAVLWGLLGSRLLTGWGVLFHTVALLTALAEALAHLGRPAAPDLAHP